MAGCLIETGDEGVTLSAQAVKRLLEKGDGDAALLYLALLRRRGTVPPRSLAGELRWDRDRIEAAEAALRQMGLVAAAEPPPEPAEEKPDYQRADVAERLERSAEFRALTDQVERKLGKRLTTPDVAVLLGLTDYLGLPADVVYLLVCHCTERVRRRLGEGRRPGMKQIEKEGYAWARMGIDTQAAAAEYLRKYAQRQDLLPQYMRAPGPGGPAVLPVGGEVPAGLAGDGLCAGGGGHRLRQDRSEVPRAEVGLLQRHPQAVAPGGPPYPRGGGRPAAAPPAAVAPGPAVSRPRLPPPDRRVPRGKGAGNSGKRALDAGIFKAAGIVLRKESLCPTNRRYCAAPTSE